MRQQASVLVWPANPPPPSSLISGLISYWNLNETSGTRVDSYGSNHLTDNNTVTSATGKSGNAASFASSSSEYLSIASNSSVQTGDIDFTIAAWVKLASKTAYMSFVSKDGDPSNREYDLYWDQSTDRLSFAVFSNGSASGGFTIINANTLGSPSTGTWYLLVAWHDSINNTVNIQVNNGTVDSAAHSLGVFVGASTFRIGANDSSGTPTSFMDGNIDEVGFWKRVLTSGEKSTLWNSGNATTYPF